MINDVLGVSGRAMLNALAAGETDAARLADLAVGKLRPKVPELTRALEGRVSAHHRFLLREYLDQLEFLERKVAVFEAAIARQADPFAQAVVRLVTVPGIEERSARALLAEVGTRREQFPSAAHLCSWACVCPGNHESAGKRQSGRTWQGNPWRRGLLTQMAWAATRKKDCYLAAQYRHLARHRSKKRALLAVAHSLLTIVWHLLTHETVYRESGADHFQRVAPARAQQQAVRRLEQLGFEVRLTRRPAA